MIFYYYNLKKCMKPQIDTDFHRLANGIEREWGIYRCVCCHHDGLEPSSHQEAYCTKCKTSYSIRHNILDTLIAPSIEVIKEIQGTAREQGLSLEQWQEMKIRKIDRITRIDDCLKLTEHDPIQYYQQTTTNFLQAFEAVKHLLQNRPNAFVLEIGAGGDYYFLKPFVEFGARCFCANIVFYYEEPDSYFMWPEKTVADMNNLPYAAGSFDIVVMSATSHHSTNLQATIQELSRITKKGGAVLMINDPIKGLIKSMGGCTEHDRDSLIHENEFTLSHYRKMFRKYGFRDQHLFSKFHDQKLQDMKIHPNTRFASIAKLASRAWQNDMFRNIALKYLLHPCQSIFGLPLNVVLWKD